MVHQQIGLPDLETKEVRQLSANPTTNHADCVSGCARVNVNKVCELFPKGDVSEVGEGLLESTGVTGKLLTSKDSDLLGKVDPPLERELVKYLERTVLHMRDR